MGQYKTYFSYEEAMKDCTQEGYQNDLITEVVFRKTLHCIELIKQRNYSIDQTNSYCSMAFLQLLDVKSEINVIDFGGACGLHYFSTRLMLPSRIKLNWAVVETNAMVKKASGLANSELSFTDSLKLAQEKLNHVDLVFSSGAIQCVPDPLDTLEEIANLKSNYIMFCRATFTEKQENLIINHRSTLSMNGKGPLPSNIQDAEVSYPYTFVSLNKFLNIIMKHYTLLFTFEDQSGGFPVNNEPILSLGMIYQKL